MIFLCVIVGGFIIIAALKAIFVNHVIAENSILLDLASWVPLYGMVVEVSSKDSDTLGNDFLPV
jgi:hypothetical protein